MLDFVSLMEPVARRLLGEPNAALSSKEELRFGSHGSVTVKIGRHPNAGQFFDHEAQEGGGVLDLIVSRNGGGKPAALEWLHREFPETQAPPTQPRQRQPQATYGYQDAAGHLIFQVVRFGDPKEFRQRQPDGTGGWLWNIKGVQQVPYRLPELTEAIACGRPVFIVEGEKDVDRAASLNIIATCNAGGAGKWPDSLTPYFVGADVIIIPDNDDAGRSHADKVAKALDGTAARIRVLPLPGLPAKGDLSNWLDAGGTVETLNTLAASAADWKRQPTAGTHFPSIWFGDEDAAKPLRWLVRGLLPDAGLSVIYGPPGTSKTFLALDLALTIASGRDWAGRRVDGGPVAYVTGEGQGGMILRLKAWRKDRGGAGAVPFVLIPASVNLFDGDTGATDLISDIEEHAIRAAQPFKLIVFDTLSRMIGSGDEDRARDINIVVQQAERIQRETGSHVLIIHHSGKDKERGMRGSNALLGAVDAALELERTEQGLCTATPKKVKDGTTDKAFKYVLRPVSVGFDDEGEELTSCVIDPTDASSGDTKAKVWLNDTDKIAVEALSIAIIESGKDRPTPDIPFGVKACKIEDWRRVAYAKGVSSTDNPEARKKAFQVTRKRLQARHMIGIEGEWVWLS